MQRRLRGMLLESEEWPEMNLLPECNLRNARVDLYRPPSGRHRCHRKVPAGTRAVQCPAEVEILRGIIQGGLSMMRTSGWAPMPDDNPRASGAARIRPFRQEKIARGDLCDNLDFPMRCC